jgi:hypothetical protein
VPAHLSSHRIELCFALVLSGIAFLIGGFLASVSNPTASYLGFYIAGGGLVVTGPAVAVLYALSNRIVMSVQDRAHRSSVRFAMSEAWPIIPVTPGTSLTVGGHPVTRFVRTIVVFWNAGSGMIDKQDLPYAVPIRFRTAGAMLDLPHMMCARGTGVRFVQDDSNELIAEFDVLHSGDGGSAEIVHDGPDFRAKLSEPWDRLESRLRLWPVLLVLPFALGFAVDLIHPFLLLPVWGRIALAVALLIVVGRNFVRFFCIWDMAFGTALSNQRFMDETDLWLRRVPKPLRDTTSGKYTLVGRRPVQRD